ncbi:MAG: VOC family protein [Burkholderiales bacterium]|nr:VOC family protein [Burkholderiales bacterium]
MSLNQVIGADHAVVAVRDLDAAAGRWRALGFTISPRGTHSPHLGSGNYTIVFDVDYIELLGVLAETPHNAPTRAFLAQREGVERVAFTALDSAAGVAELKARGIDAVGPVDFGRPVDLPDGGKSEARFRVMHWPVDERPGGLRIFACQHLTREAVWIKSLQNHANTAHRLMQIEMLTTDPKAAGAQMTRLIDQPAEVLADGAVRVRSGGNRADFIFLDLATLAKRHPGVSLAGLPAEGAVGLRIGVADAAAAAKAVGSAAVVGERSVTVPASAATGVMISFDAT